MIQHESHLNFTPHGPSCNNVRRDPWARTTLLECLRCVLEELPYEGKTPNVIGAVDSTIVVRALNPFERDERNLDGANVVKKAA